MRAWAAARDLSRRSVPDKVGTRRSWLFLAGIGLPFLAGTLLHQPRGALLGALIGMMCSFADLDQRDLGARLVILLQVAAGLALGGTAGSFLQGYPAPFWILFATLLFAAGWFTEFGKGPHLATRFCAIALGLTSGLPEIDAPDLTFVSLAFGIVAVLRCVDQVCFGPMPPPPGFNPPRLATRAEWLRFAAAYAAVAVLGLWIGVTLGMTRAIWITIAPLIVMQPNAEVSYHRVVEFMFGTTIGVVIAWVLIHTLQAPLALAIAILVLAPTIPLQFPHRFWLQTAIIAVLLLIAFRLALPDPRSVTALIVERLEDILLGCALALIGTVMAFGSVRRRSVVEETR